MWNFRHIDVAAARLALMPAAALACEDGMRFGILGPLLVDDGAGLVSVPSRRLRVLLAALLVHAGQAVPAETLADVVWEGFPPPGGLATLRTHVMRLRRALGPHAGQRLVTRYPGYLVDASEDEVDLLRFARLCHDGGAAARAGSWPEAARVLAEALALWRGQALADVPSQVLQRDHVPGLDRMRLQAQEQRIDADLHLGRHADLVPELQSLAAGQPLRERFCFQLMLALYRCGRQGEALAAYQRARSALIQELGAEPGGELHQLHQQILTADPALEAPGPAARAAAAAPVPRQLPRAVAQFVGRGPELAALTELVQQATRWTPPTVVISAIGGTAGVGKTALAVHWAHQVADRFTDGQLHVDLRGYDPGQPVTAGDALAGFLRALGVPGQQIPDETEERARLYRSRLAGRRMLVLLDNARDGEQVRPLLPGDPGCVAVVTSRDMLAGLVARDGAQRLDLDVLPPADAVGLLRSLIGPRADDDLQSAAALTVLCARLPLALRIAAELAASRPATPLRDLVAELAEGELDGLDAGEDRADVRVVFSWSLRQLPGEVAGAFALLGLHPGADLDVHAAAALTGLSTGQARRALDQLHRASLLQAGGPGRYCMHDLLGAYAREQAEAGGPSHAALTRLFDYYLAAAAAAMDVLIPAEAHNRPRVPAVAAEVPPMPGQPDARAWLDAERANLVAVAVYCADHDWPQHGTGLAATLRRYLMEGSHLPEARTMYDHALEAARRSSDMVAEADALHGLSGISIMKGHFRDAASHCQAALERYQRCGDRAGQARALRNLGVTEQELHNLEAAARCYREAIAAYEDAGDGLGVARTLAMLAYPETELGSYDQAAAHLQRALPALRAAKDQVGEADALESLADLSLRHGQLDQAADFFQQALTIQRRIGNPTGIAAELSNLGEVSLRRGEYQQASDYLRQALALFRETGYQHGEIVVMRNLAQALHGAGQSAAARAELTAALRLATETGNTYQQAKAHCDLAGSHDSAGEDEQARRHWQQALDLYTGLGAPEADEVRTRLSAGQPPEASPAATPTTAAR